MSNRAENTAIQAASISHGQRTISTHSSIRHRIINGLRTDRRRLPLALLFIVLQTASLTLEIFGGNQLAYLLASFILSVIGFLSTAYSVAVSRSARENDRNVIELVFSIVQVIMSYVHLSLGYRGIEFSPNIASIFPLVLAITVFVLACKQNEPASSVPRGRQRRLLLALLFIVLETASLALNIFGENQLAYLLASFILSVIGLLIGFLRTAYSVVVSRSARENDRNVIELVFSVVQSIMSYVHYSSAYEGIEFSPYIASIFPLVLAITVFALACKQNEPASSVTPDHIDVERGVPEDDALSDNLSWDTHLPVSNQSPTAVNREESATTPVLEENQGKSRASQISSGTTDTSGQEVIRDSKATTKPTSSETELSNLEDEQIGPNGAEGHFQIPEGQ